MLYLLYLAVIFIATILGAFVGLGGGVIIKPVLDAIHMHSLAEISFFSSCAVFLMSVTSTAKHLKNGVKLDKSIILPLSFGAVAGGLIGNYVFSLAMEKVSSSDTVKGIQSVALCALLIFATVFVNTNAKTFKLKSPPAVLFSGLLLGAPAAFLGIGGGPINVAALVLLFSFSVKDAAVYSVAVIFFSQFSNLLIQIINGKFINYDLKTLVFVLPCAVIGGLVGAVLNRKCSDKTVKITFTAAICSMILLSFYNAVTAFA